jgi:benzoyl-CoA reductase/2-hydroxyglutaryl-CoA dehydratase subunit BcrC/BadD/HgdB
VSDRAGELRCTVRLKELMGETFRRLGRVARERSAPIAWCTSVGPAEILRALGYEVFYPENHGAMLGASRKANDVMGRAHALGYSPEICSYLTSDIGAFLSRITPLQAFGLEEVPRPDVLVYNTNQCRDVRDWFEFYGRAWSVPVLGITSPRGIDEVSDDLVDGIARQLEAIIPPLEQIAGRRCDPVVLAEVIRLARECSDLWRSCLETAAHRPAPLTFFDGTIQMAPAVVLRGCHEACDYYRLLLAELRERVEAGFAAVPGERFRLYWDGMPIWGKLREHADFFRGLKTCVVASTYCNSWVFDALDPGDPIRSIGRASCELFIARSEGRKEQVLEEAARRFQAGGILFHDCRTCPTNSNTRYGLPRRLQERSGIPTLVIEGDHMDLRCYSSEQSRTSIEGFIEQMADA